jgi:large subunit ribosomal protein L13
MSTFFVKKSDVKGKNWQIVDAKGQIVGRLAAKIARILSGKTRTDYTPHTETGDGVIVINSAQVRVTGNKAKDKMYVSFSGFPGGIYHRSFEAMMAKDPTFPIMHAVKGMLPKSRLGKKMITRLLVYPGSEHPHQAQNPKTVELQKETEKK